METDEVIDELKENYPLVAQILDKVPDMSIEEAGTITLLVDGVRWLGKLHALRLLRMEDKTISDEITIKDHGNKAKRASSGTHPR